MGSVGLLLCLCLFVIRIRLDGLGTMSLFCKALFVTSSTISPALRNGSFMQTDLIYTKIKQYRLSRELLKNFCEYFILVMKTTFSMKEHLNIKLFEKKPLWKQKLTEIIKTDENDYDFMKQCTSRMQILIFFLYSHQIWGAFLPLTNQYRLCLKKLSSFNNNAF